MTIEDRTPKTPTKREALDLLDAASLKLKLVADVLLMLTAMSYKCDDGTETGRIVAGIGIIADDYSRMIGTQVDALQHVYKHVLANGGEL